MTNHPLAAAVAAALATAQAAAPEASCVTVSLRLRAAISAWPFALAAAAHPATSSLLEAQLLGVEADGIPLGCCTEESEPEEESALLLAAADLACTVEALPTRAVDACAVVAKLAVLEAAQQAVVRKALRWLSSTAEAEPPLGDGLVGATAALAALVSGGESQPCSPATPPPTRIPPMLLGTPPSAESETVSTEEVLAVVEEMAAEIAELRAALGRDGGRAVDGWLHEQLAALGGSVEG